MTSRLRSKYHRFLVKMPWLKQGLFTSEMASTAFAKILHLFESSGFKVADQDPKLKRLVAFRPHKERKCTCFYVVWVSTIGNKTYVSFGVEPRFWFFAFCGHGNHLNKLRSCAVLIGSAIDYEGRYPGSL